MQITRSSRPEKEPNSTIFKSRINLILIADVILMCAYEIIIFMGIIQSSMLRYVIDTHSFTRIEVVIATFILFISTLVYKNSYNSLLLGGLLLTSTIIQIMITKNFTFYILVAIVYGMRQIDFKKILWATMITLVIGVGSVIIMANRGLIANLIFYRSGKARNSFGMIYPLTLSAYLFSLAVGLALIKAKLKAIPFFLMLFLGVFSWIYLGARNDAITIFALCGLYFLKPLLEMKPLLLKGHWFSMIVVLLMVLTNFVSLLIPMSSRAYALVNSIFNGRISLQDVLIKAYGFTPFGQTIPENGNGGLEGQQLTSGYFYIDNSYARLLFLGGVIFFIIFMYMLFQRIDSLTNSGFIYLSLVFFVVCVNGITQESFQSASFNILLPVLMTSVSNLRVSNSN